MVLYLCVSLACWWRAWAAAALSWPAETWLSLGSSAQSGVPADIVWSPSSHLSLSGCCRRRNIIENYAAFCKENPALFFYFLQLLLLKFVHLFTLQSCWGMSSYYSVGQCSPWHHLLSSSNLEEFPSWPASWGRSPHCLCCLCQVIARSWELTLYVCFCVKRRVKDDDL